MTPTELTGAKGRWMRGGVGRRREGEGPTSKDLLKR